VASVDPLVDLAARLIDACPTPALVAAPPDRLLRLNPAASRVLDCAPGASSESLRALLGVGWLEIDTTASDGSADIVLELRARAGRERPRRWRARLEPLALSAEPNLAVVAFLEPSPVTAAPGRDGGGRNGFDSLVGSDPALLATKKAAERFAATPVPILLLAETGTGKELMARAIHGASERRGQPFVAINCGALSPQLLESELFGYAPGAFTGASREGNEGKIGAARGGTLFLDEIAEMPASLQAMLLRVLEDGTYYRVGESRPRQADVRLICATCRDLPAMVASGGFRQDLFYRINGAALTLPPLRERRDLDALLADVLVKVARELGRDAPPRLSAEAAALLGRSSWPGNVRQMKSALRFALVVCDGDELLPEHLPHDLGAPAASASAARGPLSDIRASREEEALPLPAAPAAPRTLEERERERLDAALEESRGNLSVAARALGIARTTLYRRLRKHGYLR